MPNDIQSRRLFNDIYDKLQQIQTLVLQQQVQINALQTQLSKVVK